MTHVLTETRRAEAIVRELPEELSPSRALAAVEGAPHTVFFESRGDAGESSDWTLLAFDPAWRLELRDDGVLRRFDGAGAGRQVPGRVLDALESAWPERVAIENAPAIPFLSGLAGYIGYDFKDQLERYPARARREWPLPDLGLGFYDVVWAWRRSTGKGWAVSTGLSESDPRRAERVAHERLDAQWERVTGATTKAGNLSDANRDAPRTPPTSRVVRSNFTRDSYCRMVETALEHIAEGDIYQVNLAQRFIVDGAPSAAAIYRTLRDAAPAPFLAYLELDDAGIASSSPERFFRIRGREIETWPIKGTRPRGRTAEEDASLRDELRRSEKDRAENVMIVDLERND